MIGPESDMNTATSRNGAQIRLNDERWAHIQHGHPEVTGREEILETIETPNSIFSGASGELIALRRGSDDLYLVVAYKEVI